MTRATSCRNLPTVISIALATIGIAACEAPPAPANSETPLPPPSEPTAPDVLTIYTDVEGTGPGEVLAAFHAETGRTSRLESGKPRGDALPQADLFLIGSLAELWRIAEADGFRPYPAAAVDPSVPEAARDPESRWSALVWRPRLVFFNSTQATADEIASVREYADLRNAAWRDRLCLSSSRVPGNRSLVAMLIRDHGVREAELIVRDWQANLAEPVFMDDAELIVAVEDGRCTAGIADGGMLFASISRNDTTPLALGLLAGETLADVTGAGIARHAHDPAGALELLQWLTSAAPDALLASREMAFPVHQDARVSASLADWHVHRPNASSLSEIGFLHEDAEKLAVRARYP